MSASAKQQNSRIDILLVEDNANDAELVMRALKKATLSGKIVWARDGVEALELLCRLEESSERTDCLTPTVVLLDLKLPRLDGHDVLRQIKTGRRTRTIPVVVLSSSHEEGDIERAYALGANSYVVKPVSSDAFAEAVTALGRYWLSLNQTCTPPL